MEKDCLSFSADPHQEILDYLMAHYEIRYNVLTALAEFRPQGSQEPFRVVDKRVPRLHTEQGNLFQVIPLQ